MKNGITKLMMNVKTDGYAYVGQTCDQDNYEAIINKISKMLSESGLVGDVRLK